MITLEHVLDLSYHRYETKSAEQTRATYAALMEEIKRRNQVVVDLVNGLIPPQPLLVVVEFCYLQMRFMCELIALSCLVAHGDIKGIQSKKLQKKWHADEILSHLDRLHPDFYPVPGKQVLGSNGRPSKIEPILDGYLSRSDLRDLYTNCGERLHKGSIKQLLSNRRRVIKFHDIMMWNDKIARLLDRHQIQLSDPDYQLWTIMESKTDGNVQVYLVKKIGPAQH